MYSHGTQVAHCRDILAANAKQIQCDEAARARLLSGGLVWGPPNHQTEYYKCVVRGSLVASSVRRGGPL